MTTTIEPLEPTSYPNHARVIGRNRDWTKEGSPYLGNVSRVTDEFSGAMPISLSHKRHADGKYRSGGSWYIFKTETKWGTTGVIDVYRGNRIAYSGSLVGTYIQNPRANANTISLTNEALNVYNGLPQRGAEAWNRLRPDLPDFTLTTSILELKDFLPDVKNQVQSIIRKMAGVPPTKKSKRRSSELSRAGQHYLAAQFGWLPLVKDITKYIILLSQKDKRMRQLLRDHSRPIRRRRELKDSLSNSVSTNYHTIGQSTNFAPGFVTQCYPSYNAENETTLDRQYRTWCEGSFSYMLPPGPRDLKWNKKLWRKLMGGIVTPREVYELMPWSWMVDYFTDLGQFVSAVSPGVADRLYCQYAYLMRSHIQTATSVSRDKVYTGKNGAESLLQVSNIRRSSIKCRHAASPFGFGFKSGNLTLKQTAILGALGLSRLP